MPQYGNLRMNNAAANELDKRAKLEAKKARQQFRIYLEDQCLIAPGSYYNAINLKMMRAETLQDILSKFGFDPTDPVLYWEEEADEEAGLGKALVQRFKEQEGTTEEPIVDTVLLEPVLTRGDLMDRFLGAVDHGVLDCVIARLGLEARVTHRATYLERVSETVTVADNTQSVGLQKLDEARVKCSNTINPR